MVKFKVISLTSKIISKDIEADIYECKKSGMSDVKIGAKFGVGLTAIEKAVTKISGVNINIPDKIRNKVKSWEPKNFRLEQQTVWSFKSRGNWATHTSNYRGNWSPYIPRNIILKYSKEDQIVLDCFCGSGVTAIESKLLNRNFYGIDINPQAIDIAKENINEIPTSLLKKSKMDINVGDAKDLFFLKDESIDLICTHPPYANILKYTDNSKQDLSFLKIDDFLENMVTVVKENYRVLKNGNFCAILIGDMRKNKHIIPLGFRLIDIYLKNGFVIKELIIKRQHNCRTTGFWYKNSIKYNFLLLAHEFLVVFQKSKKSKVIQPTFITPKKMNKLNQIDKNDKVETMTVWVEKKDKWYQHMINNLVGRYNGENHQIINDIKKLKNKKTELIVWDIRSNSNLSSEIAENIGKKIIEGGYLAILCEDIRLEDGTLHPTALITEKELSKTQLFKMREIIIISIENGFNPNENIKDLMINHKYVLVYQKIITDNIFNI